MAKVNVEAVHAPDDGVLIGAASRWVLLAAPVSESALVHVWRALNDESLGPDELVVVVERAADPLTPGLAILDLTIQPPVTHTRGSGQVVQSGSTWSLALGGAASTTRPAASSTGLIDGIPEAILAATGPDGPPPPRDRSQAPEWVSPNNTGTSIDTTEPEPDVVERIEEGGHTTIREPEVDDHDGSTVNRPSHLSPTPTPTVLAMSCPSGHLTPATSPACRLCHQRLAPQEPRQVARPTLGGLRLPTGEVVPLDRGVVLGRKPAPLEGTVDWPHLVHLPASHSYVSRLHLQIELDGWEVVARDLDSRGGTTLAPPGGQPQRMRAQEAYVLEPGTVLDLAEVYAVRYEIGSGSRG